jgi:hypothetical protein
MGRVWRVHSGDRWPQLVEKSWTLDQLFFELELSIFYSYQHRRNGQEKAR